MPLVLFSVVVLSAIAGAQSNRPLLAPGYALAFASFAPLNTDIFIAGADGSDARPLLPGADLDYNPSFSADGGWIVFTSTRSGSADVYQVRPDGSGLARLTDDPAFDDQGALSPDGRSLAFVSSRSGQADIRILDLATRTFRNLTANARLASRQGRPGLIEPGEAGAGAIILLHAVMYPRTQAPAAES